MVLGRRDWLKKTAAAAGASSLGHWLPILQEDDPEKTALLMMTRRTRQAVQDGLDFLARRQNEDGSFGRGPYSRNAGVCSLAGLSFLAQGTTPGRGRYGRELIHCVAYILECCQDDGFITNPGYQSHGPMYGHGFATLLLAEVYGMAPTLAIRDRLIAAVGRIIDSQNDEGGWRYQPQRDDADLSVTVCQVMALRAARNAGIYVPHDTIDRCVEYVKRCQNPDGGFMYMLDGGESDFPRSAAGVVALFNAGIYEGEEISRGLDYLMQFAPTRDSDLLSTYFYYGHYYAVQAMWQAGGSRWSTWYPSIRDWLLDHQISDGNWLDSIGADYATAMATLILQMPNNYLPIFQR